MSSAFPSALVYAQTFLEIFCSVTSVKFSGLTTAVSRGLTLTRSDGLFTFTAACAVASGDRHVGTGAASWRVWTPLQTTALVQASLECLWSSSVRRWSSRQCWQSGSEDSCTSEHWPRCCTVCLFCAMASVPCRPHQLVAAFCIENTLLWAL